MSECERRVAALVAVGHRSREVADALGVRLTRVETHLSSAYRKLGVRTRTELALLLVAGRRRRRALVQSTALKACGFPRFRANEHRPTLGT